MNKVILKGRLTADPELRKTNNGIAVTKFSVAIDRRYDKEKTDFINCEAWRNTAEFICKYFSKGKEIAVIGELHIDRAENNGEVRYFTTVVVDEVEFCGTKNNSIDVEATMKELEEDESLPF